MTTTIEPIKILMGSDFHFGIPSVNQEEMAHAFAETIFPLLCDSDVFFINGDFFDTLVIFDNHGFDPIYDTILKLFAICEEKQVTLRILQGTWMHDRNQCKRFETFYRNSGFTFNFRFAEGIELETITLKDRDLRIMYVPDDLPFKTSDDIVDVVKQKMVEKGWDYVDYGCMHGFFEFTFPKGVSQENTVVFKESQFDFVRKMIDVGHVHQNRVQGKVISNGSFDRMCFGDEDPKGCVRVFDYPDHYTAQFIENKNAAVYDTLVIGLGDTTETISQKVNDHLDSLTTKRKISLRFNLEALEHKDAIKNWMKEVHPDVRFTIKKVGEVEGKPMVIPSSAIFTPVEKRIAPTLKTISSFVRARVPQEYVMTIDRIDALLELSP